MDIASTIRHLSSGTISKIVRDAYFRTLGTWLRSSYTSRYGEMMQITPNHTADQWIIDRIQHAFAVFAETSRESFPTWQDAWHAYLNRMGDVRFKCSYQGATEYRVTGVSQTFEARCSASDHMRKTYNGDAEKFARNVEGVIGGIYTYCGATEGFPPDHIACLFPLETPAKWENGWVMNPAWPAPRLGTDETGSKCAYHRDAKFKSEPQQWESWRNIANASHLIEA